LKGVVGSFAFFTAVNHQFPIFSQFFSPAEWPVADRTCLIGQIGFLHSIHCQKNDLFNENVLWVKQNILTNKGCK
jgi:hypothetical protein